MVPASELVRLAAQRQLDAPARLDPADDRKAEGLRRGGKKLIVLAETDIVELRSRGKGHALQLDHESHAGAHGDMAGVAREAVRDVEHRGRDARQPFPFLDAVRHRRQRPRTERRACGAERPGHDDGIAGLCSGAARDALRAAQRGHREDHAVRARRIAAANRHATFVQAEVELEHIGELGLGGQPKRDEQGERIGTGGGEIADVDGGRACAQLEPAQEVEAEVNSLDQRILRHDEPLHDGGVVLDPLRQPAPLELGQEPELPELVEPRHSSEIRARPSSVSGSSAASAS